MVKCLYSSLLPISIILSESIKTMYIDQTILKWRVDNLIKYKLKKVLYKLLYKISKLSSPSSLLLKICS